MIYSILSGRRAIPAGSRSICMFRRSQATAEAAHSCYRRLPCSTQTSFRILGSSLARRHSSSVSRTGCIRQQQHRTFYSERSQNNTTGMYMLAVAILTCTASYAAVPLYRLFCQATGYGGTTQEKKETDMSSMVLYKNRPLRIRFNADTSTDMRWQFRPQQAEVRVVPGQSALAFYTATNPTNEAITGISTYNVIPFEAGQYFNKIQCFCFEEQRLSPHEQVDMPVFFYIDPEFAEDPNMAKVKEITLSYTFFESKNFDYQKWSASMPVPSSAP